MQKDGSSMSLLQESGQEVSEGGLRQFGFRSLRDS